MSDVMERAEATLRPPVAGSPIELVHERCAIIRELVAELKAARAEVERLKTLRDESVRASYNAGFVEGIKQR